jgi:hypothetical protein
MGKVGGRFTQKSFMVINCVSKLNLGLSSELFVAHVEPYRISDLERLKAEISDHPLVQIR